MGANPHILGGQECLFDLAYSPGLSCSWVAAHFRRREPVKSLVIGRMDGDELALLGGKVDGPPAAITYAR